MSKPITLSYEVFHNIVTHHRDHARKLKARVKELELELEQERATVEGYIDLYAHTRRKNQITQAKLYAAAVKARDAVEFQVIFDEVDAVLKEFDDLA